MKQKAITQGKFARNKYLVDYSIYEFEDVYDFVVLEKSTFLINRLTNKKQSLKQKTLYEMLFDDYTGLYFDLDTETNYPDFFRLIHILYDQLDVKVILYGGYSNDEEIAKQFQIDYLPETDKRLSIHIWSPYVRFNKVKFKEVLSNYQSLLFDKSVYSSGMQKFRLIFGSKDKLNDKKSNLLNIVGMNKTGHMIKKQYKVSQIKEYKIDVKWLFVQYYTLSSKEFQYEKCVEQLIKHGFLKLKTY